MDISTKWCPERKKKALMITTVMIGMLFNYCRLMCHPKLCVQKSEPFCCTHGFSRSGHGRIVLTLLCGDQISSRKVLKGWGLEAPGGSFTHTTDAWIWLRPSFGELTHCPSLWLWWPRVSHTPFMVQGSSLLMNKAFYDLCLKIRQLLSYHTLLVEECTSPPRFKWEGHRGTGGRTKSLWLF